MWFKCLSWTCQVPSRAESIQIKEYIIMWEKKSHYCLTLQVGTKTGTWERLQHLEGSHSYLRTNSPGFLHHISQCKSWKVDKNINHKHWACIVFLLNYIFISEISMGYVKKGEYRNTIQTEITWVPLIILKCLEDDLTLHEDIWKRLDNHNYHFFIHLSLPNHPLPQLGRRV